MFSWLAYVALETKVYKRCIASIHFYVVNEGKFDLTMDASGKPWYEYVYE